MMKFYLHLLDMMKEIYIQHKVDLSGLQRVNLVDTCVDKNTVKLWVFVLVKRPLFWFHRYT